MQKNTIYEAPALEVIVLEVENAILAASGEGSNVKPGWPSTL